MCVVRVSPWTDCNNSYCRNQSVLLLLLLRQAILQYVHQPEMYTNDKNGTHENVMFCSIEILIFFSFFSDISWLAYTLLLCVRILLPLHQTYARKLNETQRNWILQIEISVPFTGWWVGVCIISLASYVDVYFHVFFSAPSVFFILTLLHHSSFYECNQVIKNAAFIYIKSCLSNWRTNIGILLFLFVLYEGIYSILFRAL